MNFARTFGVGIFILVFLTVSSDSSAQYLTGMFFYLAKSVIDGGLPGIIRTVRAGKSVPFIPELTMQQRNDITTMATARARRVVNEMDSDSKVRRLLRQLWPDLDCETDNTCKVSADTVLKSDSRENGASGSTSSSEEGIHASAEEEPMGNYYKPPENNFEDVRGDEEQQDNNFFSSAEREKRRKQRRRNRQREREGPPGGPPPPPPPFHFHDNNDMFHDGDDGDGPPGPPPPGYGPSGPPPPGYHMGHPPPPWLERPFRHFHHRPQFNRIREKVKPNPIPVTPKRNPVSHDFIKFSKVFKPNPTTTTPKPVVISKRFLRILRQHPSVTVKIT